MVAERRQSSRIKAELPGKRRLSEIEAEKPTPPRKRQRTPSKVDQPAEPTGVLPTKLSDGKPLPTLRKPQPSDLLDSDYQSVLESGVLLASFTRSRQIWTHGTLLEKFWTKTKTLSAKKMKEMTEEEKATHKAAKGPAMSKAGSATITIEPHAFEITLFVVKDTTPGIKQGQLPPERQFQQYNAPPPPLAPVYRPPPQYQPPTPVRTVQYQTPPPPRPIHVPPMKPPANIPAAPPPAPSKPQASSAKPRPNPAPAPAPPKPNPGPDPVIKALAARAAGNSELKRVMKVVAQGNASTPELEYFQKHIAELTALFEKEKHEKEKWKPQSMLKPPQPPVARPPVQNHPPYPANGMAPRPPNMQYTYPNPQPPRPRIVSTPAPLQVLIQFGENANDRYAFPKNSILEFLPGTNSVICSFIIVKSGSDAVDKYGVDPKVEYWQPVTMKISAESHILDMIGRVVATADEVRAYMNGVMNRCTRAEEVSLAFRLPKDNGVIDVA